MSTRSGGHRGDGDLILKIRDQLPIVIGPGRDGHRAATEDQLKAGKEQGLRSLPSNMWPVDTAWMLHANIAADLTCWTRLLGLADNPDLASARVDTSLNQRTVIPEPSRSIIWRSTRWRQRRCGPQPIASCRTSPGWSR